MKQLDNEAVMDYLRKQIAALGSQQKFAERADISEQYLSDVLRGVRPIGDRVLDALGFERVVTFQRKVR